MIEKPVCIIGCGPIGLSFALLLAEMKVPTLIVEQRFEPSPHPRSRFVDTNTMELMRLLGIEREVLATGLGPSWTSVNRWGRSLIDPEQTAIPSPTFHTVPRESSPCCPVMTCQDYVERELLKAVDRSDLIECRFGVHASILLASDDVVELSLEELDSGSKQRIKCDFLIGADGPHSATRRFMDSVLESDPLPIYSQDIIFDADLSPYVGERKGSLLYTATSSGVSVFQPLDGQRRWRVQLFKSESEDLEHKEILDRIKQSVGDETVELSIQSVGHWQPIPGCTSKMKRGRVFLVGDAAHVATPAGGMGNNIGFLGVRNLAWKLAYVLRGIAPIEILETYQEEVQPAALKRIGHGVSIGRAMSGLIRAIYANTDRGAAIEATSIYADYDGIILGHETLSPLLALEPEVNLDLIDPIRDYQPLVRSGRRAPHIWLDAEKNVSLVDSFKFEYTLVAGCNVDSDGWNEVVENLNAKTPVSLVVLHECLAQEAYDRDGLVLVRPDGLVADHWMDYEIAPCDRSGRLASKLPDRNLFRP